MQSRQLSKGVGRSRKTEALTVAGAGRGETGGEASRQGGPDRRFYPHT